MDNFISENDSGPITSFDVDLSREQYIKFNRTFHDVVLRRKSSNILIFLLMTVITNVLFFIMDRKVNIIMLVISLICLFVAIYSTFFGPNSKRKMDLTANKTYTQHKLTGKSFYGKVSIYHDKIVKQSGEITTELAFDDNMLYIEDSDAVIFIVPNQPGIIIPTQYVTHDQLDMIRNIAFQKIAPNRRHIVNPVVEVPFVPPMLKETDNSDKIKLTISYDKKETKNLVIESMMQMFLKRFPAESFVALIFVVVLFFEAGPLYGIIGFAGFLLLDAALLIYRIVNGTRAMQKAMEDGNYFVFEIGDDGVLIKKNWDSSEAGFLWQDVKKALKKPQSVDFIVENGFVSIPIRCINDFQHFEEIVEKNMKPEKK